MTGKTVRCLVPLALAVLLGVAGCGDKSWQQNDTVEGTVTLDATPVVGVVVQFVPDDPAVQGPPSTGTTDDKGHFTLTCDNRKAGAVIAKHNVVILKGRNDAGVPMGAGIPSVYTVAAQTPVQVQVTANEHTYDVKLSRNPPARPK